MATGSFTRDQLLGEMAVQAKYITREQLHECIGAQKATFPPAELAAILKGRGLVPEPEMLKLLEVVQHHIDSAQPPPPADPMLGKTLIGEFRLVRLLGRGGVGSVYLADQISLARPVAIKLLSFSAGEKDQALERFQREARAAGRLQHPNIVQVYLFGKGEEQQHFIAMEYVEGESLAACLQRVKRLPVLDALKVVREVAKALSAAHKEGFVHRDVKPDNIFIKKDGAVKLGDFGLARDMGGNANLSLTGQIMGTPNYMSPEQGHGRKVDGRSDLYSLGATLFTSLTGRTPYTGDSPLSVIIAHATAPIPLASALRPEVPQAVDALLQRLLAKEVEKRPAGADEVIAQITALLEGKQVTARPALDPRSASRTGGPNDLLARPGPPSSALPPRSSPLTPIPPSRPHPPLTLDSPTPAPRPRPTPAAAHSPVPASSPPLGPPSPSPRASELQALERRRLVSLAVGGGLFAVVAAALLLRSLGGSGPVVAAPVETRLDALRKNLDAHSDDFPYVLEHVDAFVSADPASPDAAEAKKLRGNAERRREALCEGRLSDLQTAAAAAIAKGDPTAALAGFEAWPPSLATPAWTERLRRERQKTLESLTQRLQATLASIRAAYAATKDFETARTELRAWEPRVASIEGLAPLVQAEVAAVDQAEKLHLEEIHRKEEQARAADSQRILDQARDVVSRAARDFRFAEALEKCTATEPQLLPEDAPKIAELRREVLSQQGALDRLASRLEQKLQVLAASQAGPDKYPKLPDVERGRAKGTPMTVTACSAQGLEVAAGGARTSLAWNKVPARNLYQLAATLVPPETADEHFELGVFSLFQGLLDEAEKEFKEFARAGGDGAAVATYQQRTAKAMSDLAQELCEQAKAAQARREFDAAIAAALRLRNQFEERDFARARLEEVDGILRQSLLDRLVEPAGARPPELFAWNEAGPLPPRWAPGKDGAWAAQDGCLVARGMGAVLEAKGAGGVCELAGLVCVTAAEGRPPVQIRLGSFELKLMDTGAVYCKDTAANLQRNTPESVVPGVWYCFRLYREKLPGGKERVHMALDDHELTAFDSGSTRTPVSFEVGARGPSRGGGPPGGYVKFDNVLLRSEE